MAGTGAGTRAGWVETRAPRATHVLAPGGRCSVPPMTAHHVHGRDGMACRFLIVQGVGDYDYVAVGGSAGAA